MSCRSCAVFGFVSGWLSFTHHVLGLLYRWLSLWYSKFRFKSSKTDELPSDYAPSLIPGKCATASSCQLFLAHCARRFDTRLHLAPHFLVVDLSLQAF